jgi:hypothetical protein
MGQWRFTGEFEPVLEFRQADFQHAGFRRRWSRPYLAT